MESDKKYFVLDGEENKGPFSFNEVLEQEITPQTYLWYYGLDGWKFAHELAEFKEHFAAISPPEPPKIEPVVQEASFTPETNIEGVEKPFDSAKGEMETTPVDTINQPSQATYAPIPENYLLYSAIVSLIMCLPLGVIALYYSTQVHPRYYRGDLAGALDASQNAKQWCTIGFIVTAIFWGFMILGFVFGF